ncbi:hypothetical protein NOVO_01050 [Rickettsiales bacterium Ac37b]|nr:hypothetical protein NOVO_01050 [Rickettsiales bacterium Ac37b]
MSTPDDNFTKLSNNPIEDLSGIAKESEDKTENLNLLSQDEAIKLIQNMINSEDENKILANYHFHNLDLTSIDLSTNYIMFDQCSFNGTKVNRKSFEYLINLARSGKVNIEGINVSNTDLSKKHVDRINLGLSAYVPVKASGTNLTNANFSRSQLEGMEFNNCILVNSNFSGSNVKNASFHEANVDMANFKGSNITPEQISETENFTTIRLDNADYIKFALIILKQKAEKLKKSLVVQKIMHKLKFTIANVFSDHDMDNQLGKQARKILEERKEKSLSNSPKKR